MMFVKNTVNTQGSARSRIHIERNMRELRTYRAFSEVISLKEMDVHDCVVEVARFLCNLKPRLHDWTDRSFGAMPVAARQLNGDAASEAKDKKEDEELLSTLF